MALKTHRKIIVRAALIGIVVSAYDVLLHSLFELLHLLFEWFELGLEELIEHIFHTTRHQTQIIVFYLLCSLFLFGLYRLWRALPRFHSYLLATRARYWAQMNCYWQECSWLQKAKVITACSAGVGGLCLWLFI